MTDFRDVVAAQRFEQGFVDPTGQTRTVWADYAVQKTEGGGDRRAILHVEAEDELRGTGAAGLFMQQLADHARAEKLTKRAAKVGFDWPDFEAVRAKVEEEIAEVSEAVAAGDQAAAHEEIGDLLFAVANLARKAGVDAEAALRDANQKFTRRFHYVEERARQDNVPVETAGLDRLDGYWNEVRAADKAE